MQARLIVQENVAAQLIQKLKNRMDHMRVGDPLDKCIDMGAIVDQSQWDTIDGWVKTGISEGAECYQPDIQLPEKGPLLQTHAPDRSRSCGGHGSGGNLRPCASFI